MTALLFGALFAGLLAVAYPVVALAAVTLAVVGRPLVRGLQSRLRARRHAGRSRQVCVPRTGVCVEV